MRVDRMLRGERNARDVDKLLVWLRSRSLGNALVADLGHFAAHLEDRDRGHAWQGLQHVNAMVQYHIGRTLTGRSTKEAYAAAMRGCLSLMQPESVKRNLGVGPKKARRALETAISKIVYYDEQSVIKTERMSRLEDRILDCLGPLLSFTHRYNEIILFEQLSNCLMRNKFIQSDDTAKLREQIDFIALVAMEKMHLARVKLENGEVVVLNMHVLGELLGVSAKFSVDGQEGKALDVLYPIFESNCRCEDWIENWPGSISGEFNWDAPLEINKNGRLEFL